MGSGRGNGKEGSRIRNWKRTQGRYGPIHLLYRGKKTEAQGSEHFTNNSGDGTQEAAPTSAGAHLA